MPESPSNSITDAPAPRFRFGVGGMMVFVVGVAVALTVAGPGNSDIPTMILSAVALWFALSLLNQARDLWATFRGRRDLESDERWGWRYAAVWRVALAALLLGYLVVSYLLNRETLDLGDVDDPFFFSMVLTGPSIMFVGLTAALVSAFPAATKSTGRPWWRRLVDVLIFGLLSYVALRVWAEEMIIFALVHVATVGIELSQPLAYRMEGVDVDAVARMMRFFWITLLACVVALMNLVVIRRIARWWSWGWRIRLLLFMVLGIGVAASGAYVVWARAVGFASAAPFTAQALVAAPWHLWAQATLLLLMLVTVGAYRLTRTREPNTSSANIDWRVHARRYYHEQAAPALLIVVASIGLAVQVISYESIGGLSEWAVYVLFLTPFGYLLLAAFLPALTRCIAAVRRKWQPPAASIPRINPFQFAVVWTALLLTIVLAVPAIAALSFCVWLIPFDVFPMY